MVLAASLSAAALQAHPRASTPAPPCPSAGEAHAALRRGLVQHGRAPQAAGMCLCVAAVSAAAGLGRRHSFCACAGAGSHPCTPGVRSKPNVPCLSWPPPPALQGELEKAITAYEHALAAAPNLEVVQQNMAAALTEWGTHLKAAGAPLRRCPAACGWPTQRLDFPPLSRACCC